MTGFIKGLFRRNKSDNQPAENQSQSQAQPQQKKEKAFFLSPDDAKTYGDIDYMRTAKTIKRTFPKTKSNPDSPARVEQVSAMDSMKMSDSPNGSTPDYMKMTPSKAGPQDSSKPDYMQSTPYQNDEGVKSDPSSAEERRRTDTSMDMFRNMAKDMKRG